MRKKRIRIIAIFLILVFSFGQISWAQRTNLLEEGEIEATDVVLALVAGYIDSLGINSNWSAPEMFTRVYLIPRGAQKIVDICRIKNPILRTGVYMAVSAGFNIVADFSFSPHSPSTSTGIPTDTVNPADKGKTQKDKTANTVNVGNSRGNLGSYRASLEGVSRSLIRRYVYQRIAQAFIYGAAREFLLRNLRIHNKQLASFISDLGAQLIAHYSGLVLTKKFMVIEKISSGNPTLEVTADEEQINRFFQQNPDAQNTEKTHPSTYIIEVTATEEQINNLFPQDPNAQNTEKTSSSTYNIIEVTTNKEQTNKSLPQDPNAQNTEKTPLSTYVIEVTADETQMRNIIQSLKQQNLSAKIIRPKDLNYQGYVIGLTENKTEIDEFLKSNNTKFWKQFLVEATAGTIEILAKNREVGILISAGLRSYYEEKSSFKESLIEGIKSALISRALQKISSKTKSPVHGAYFNLFASSLLKSALTEFGPGSNKKDASFYKAQLQADVSRAYIDWFSMGRYDLQVTNEGEIEPRLLPFNMNYLSRLYDFMETKQKYDFNTALAYQLISSFHYQATSNVRDILNHTLYKIGLARNSPLVGIYHRINKGGVDCKEINEALKKVQESAKVTEYENKLTNESLFGKLGFADPQKKLEEVKKELENKKNKTPNEEKLLDQINTMLTLYKKASIPPVVQWAQFLEEIKGIKFYRPLLGRGLLYRYNVQPLSKKENPQEKISEKETPSLPEPPQSKPSSLPSKSSSESTPRITYSWLQEGTNSVWGYDNNTGNIYIWDKKDKEWKLCDNLQKPAKLHNKEINWIKGKIKGGLERAIETARKIDVGEANKISKETLKLWKENPEVFEEGLRLYGDKKTQEFCKNNPGANPEEVRSIIEARIREKISNDKRLNQILNPKARISEAIRKLSNWQGEKSSPFTDPNTKTFLAEHPDLTQRAIQNYIKQHPQTKQNIINNLDRLGINYLAPKELDK